MPLLRDRCCRRTPGLSGLVRAHDSGRANGRIFEAKLVRRAIRHRYPIVPRRTDHLRNKIDCGHGQKDLPVDPHLHPLLRRTVGPQIPIVRQQMVHHGLRDRKARAAGEGFGDVAGNAAEEAPAVREIHREMADDRQMMAGLLKAMRPCLF